VQDRGPGGGGGGSGSARRGLVSEPSGLQRRRGGAGADGLGGGAGGGVSVRRLLLAASVAALFGGCQSCVTLPLARYACKYELHDNSQCPGGWKCGVEDYCHDPLDVKAWSCFTDDDCSAKWRCGVGGTCVDPKADALKAHSSTLGAGKRVNPLLFTSAPAALAVSPIQALYPSWA